ncbi:MAG: thiamine diphosphokinase [Bacillota bacterium]
MIVKIFINPINYTLDNLYKKDDNEYLIGVDKGAFHALSFGLTLNRVMGDFDSITQVELDYIKRHAKTIDKYPEKKDETDSYLAIKEALKLDPDEIIVYGGIGNRLDHTYANIQLLKQGDITFLNDVSKMYVLSPGEYTIKNTHKYISFFALESVKKLSLTDFDYPLSDYNLDIDDPLAVSNKGEGTVTFDDGLLLVIHQNE